MPKTAWVDVKRRRKNRGGVHLTHSSVQPVVVKDYTTFMRFVLLL
jgi:hypothetical protein